MDEGELLHGCNVLDYGDFNITDGLAEDLLCYKKGLVKGMLLEDDSTWDVFNEKGNENENDWEREGVMGEEKAGVSEASDAPVVVTPDGLVVPFEDDTGPTELVENDVACVPV